MFKKILDWIFLKQEIRINQPIHPNQIFKISFLKNKNLKKKIITSSQFYKAIFKVPRYISSSTKEIIKSDYLVLRTACNAFLY